MESPPLAGACELAATLVTVVIAAPVLFISALWEVFVAPHLLQGLIGY